MEASLSNHREQYTVKDPKRRFEDPTKAAGELYQLKNDNQKLIRENAELKNSSRQLEGQSGVRLNESSKALSIASSPVRGLIEEGTDTVKLKRELDQLNSINMMLQNRSDGLVIENNELKRKIAFLEKELREAQLRASSSDPQTNLNALVSEKDALIK